MTRGTCTAAVVAALIVCGEAASWAGGFTLSSFGGRRGGMLANAGRPDEPTALIHNPAGLADQPGVQTYLFVSPAILSLGFEMQALDGARYTGINPAGCGSDGAVPCPWPVGADGYYTRRIEPERTFGVLPYLGGSTDLGFASPSLRDVVVSLAFHAPNFYGAFFPEDAPTAYGFIGGMFLVSSATLGAGWRINEHVAVGASVSYNLMHISMSQKLSVIDLLTEEGAAPGGTAQLAQTALGDVRLEYAGIDHGVGWGAAVLLSPVQWLGIGLGYNGATPARFRGDVSLIPTGRYVDDERAARELARDLGYALPRRLQLQMSVPHGLVAGVNVALGAHVELGLDLRLWLYNLCGRQEIEPLYDDGDTGERPITTESLSRDKDYRVSYQVTGGVLVRPWRTLRGLEVMAGAGYDQSPIPDDTLTIDNPSLSQIKVSSGVRWRIDPHWRVSATYMLVLYLRRDITTSQVNPPNNIRGAGVSHSPALAVTYTL